MRNYDADVEYNDEQGQPIGVLVQVRAEDRKHARQVIAVVMDDEGVESYEVADLYEVCA